MRRFLLFTLLASLMAPARAADRVVRQSITRTGADAIEETLYLTTTKLVAAAPQTTTIVDAEAKKLTAIAKPNRSYMVTTFDGLEQMRRDDIARWAALPEELRERATQAWGAGTPLVLTPTGKTDTIAGHVAAEHTIAGNTLTGSLWFAKNVALPDGLRRWQWFTRSDAANGAYHELANLIGAQSGLVLRASITETHATMVVTQTLEVRAIEEGPLPADLLVVPAHFEEQKRPTAPVNQAP